MYSDRLAWVNSIDPYQMLHSAASDMGLHCNSSSKFLDTKIGSQMDLNFRTSMVMS